MRSKIASQFVPNLAEKTAELLKVDVELQDCNGSLATAGEKG